MDQEVGEQVALPSPSALLSTVENQDRPTCIELLKRLQNEGVKQSRFVFPKETSYEEWVSVFFACFKLQNQTIDQIACDLLTLILTDLEPHTFLTEHKDALKVWADYKGSPTVRAFSIFVTLSQIINLPEEHYHEYEEFCQTLFMKALKDKEISVANAALHLVSDLVGKFGKFKEWALLASTWEILDNEADVIYLRALEMLKDVCMSSMDIKKAFVDTRLIERIFQRINFLDLLASISILELLASVCESVNLFSILCEHGLFEMLDKVLSQVEDALFSLAVPSVFGIVAAIVQFQGVLPELIAHVNVIKYIHDSVINNSFSSQVFVRMILLLYLFTALIISSFCGTAKCNCHFMCLGTKSRCRGCTGT
eukprot:m.98896 g.98896  ORF g.98896 m.98896 type:complete len:368 (+) comp9024_c1_seq2:109-1212(+)